MNSHKQNIIIMHFLDSDKNIRDSDHFLRFRIANRNIFVAITLSLVFSGVVFSQKKTSFIIAKSEINDSYTLCAIFDKDITGKVLASVNSHMIKNDCMFLKRTPLEKTILLNDKVTFHINLKPGELRIKFKKSNNTKGRYDILKSRCRDLEEKISEACGHFGISGEVKEFSIADQLEFPKD